MCTIRQSTLQHARWPFVFKDFGFVNYVIQFRFIWLGLFDLLLQGYGAETDHVVYTEQSGGKEVIMDFRRIKAETKLGLNSNKNRSKSGINQVFSKATLTRSETGSKMGSKPGSVYD